MKSWESLLKVKRKIPFYGERIRENSILRKKKNLLDFSVGVRQLFYYWWFVFLYL